MRSLGAIIFCTCLSASVASAAERAEPAEPLSPAQAESLFVAKVRPLLQLKCTGCHGDDAEKLKANFDMRTREGLLRGGESGEPAIAPGDAQKSPLYIAVTWRDELFQMPPKERNRLTAQEVEWVRRWIEAGAPWSDRKPSPADADWAHADGVPVKTIGGLSDEWTNRRYDPADLWAYQPVTKPDVPWDALEKGQARHPIDAFLQRRLKAADLAPAPRADKLTLIRRATFDLTGLPPTPREIEAFVNDDSPGAWGKLVDRLLLSRHYGQRMAQHWLDVVRYADTDGYSNDYERPHAWRYRDYIVRAFNQDKAYDRFIVEQIAGDELYEQQQRGGEAPAEPDVELLIATGFLRTGPWEQTAMSVAAVTRQLWLDDVTNSVGLTFLAQGMSCFKCHDHKFDPLPARDYYRVQAVFATTQFAERDAPFLEAEATAEFDAMRAIVEAQHDPKSVRPITTIDNDNIVGRITKKRKAYLDLALKRFEPKAFSVRSGKGQDVHILRGGMLESPGSRVEPGVLSLLADGDGGEFIPEANTGRRLALAKWIADPANPLTARVMVNRIWQMHFGRGIVATPNTFGKMGSKPTHPEMLDWLATRFVEDGWSIKKLHRLVMTSRAYQQAGTRPDLSVVKSVDPNNELLAWFPARRLTAEELRDAMLAVTGELSNKAGGPGVFPEINWEVALQPRHIMGGVAPVYQPSPTPDMRNRRTIYAFRYRTLSDPMLDVFNRPGPDTSCELRDETTVTPQVFALFNGQFAHDRAIALALRLEKDAGADGAKRVERAFGLLYGRAPSESELAACLSHVSDMTEHHRAVSPRRTELPKLVKREMIAEQSGELFFWEEKLALDDYERDARPWDIDAGTRALAELCLVLLNSSEFMYVY